MTTPPHEAKLPEWVMVPRVPTEAMLDVMHERVRILVDPVAKSADIQNDHEVWSAMLAAAPTPIADDALVEIVAKVIYQEDSLDGLGDDARETMLSRARAAIAAMPAPQGEVERLRRVAKPILDHMDKMIDMMPPDEPGVTDADGVCIQIGWLRAFRAALAEGPDHAG